MNRYFLILNFESYLKEYFYLFYPVPIFQYFSPSVQSVRDSCRTFIQIDRRGEKYDGERNMYFNRIKCQDGIALQLY